MKELLTSGPLGPAADREATEQLGLPAGSEVLIITKRHFLLDESQLLRHLSNDPDHRPSLLRGPFVPTPEELLGELNRFRMPLCLPSGWHVVCVRTPSWREVFGLLHLDNATWSRIHAEAQHRYQLMRTQPSLALGLAG